MRSLPFHNCNLPGLSKVLLAVWVSVGSFACLGQNVALQNATSTYYEAFRMDPGELHHWVPGDTIDGIRYGDYTSWTITDHGLSFRQDETIVWETVSDLNLAAGGRIIFDLYHREGKSGLQDSLGCFRLSYTTDDRSLFADGLGIGGDVSANWTVLTPGKYSSSGDDYMIALADNSLLIPGGYLDGPTYPVYTITSALEAKGITGFRLEVLSNPSLAGGPGRNYVGGDFFLSEFVVTAVPEPASCAQITGIGLLGLLGIRRLVSRPFTGNT